MITKQVISSLIEEKLAEDGAFLVENKVSPTNKIYVEIDSLDGVSINYCVEISKHIESQLEPEIDDYDLEVSTSSISAPFKVHNHYVKNLGKDVEVATLDNKKVVGLLKEVNEATFVLETESMQKIDGKKKKQLVVETLTYSYEDVRSTALVINFK